MQLTHVAPYYITVVYVVYL